MRTARFVASRIALALMLLAAAPLAANDLTNFTAVPNSDFQAFGASGMRGQGTGNVVVSGISGRVTAAYLFWHGPTNDPDDANATVSFAGTSVTGVNIGISSDNCWGFQNSKAYRADVTALVSGNGTYALANFTKRVADVNGVSLLIFYDDGNAANNHDYVLFNGNDSNQPNNFDAPGWNATLSGINYTSGTVSMFLVVSDGQTFSDNGLAINSTQVVAPGNNWQGNSLPDQGTARFTNGGLWDHATYDITPILQPGPNTLTLTSVGFSGDCLSLILVMFVLPVGSVTPPCAPPLPPVLAVDPTSVQIGQTATFAWNATLFSGQGSYDLQRSVGGSPYTSVAMIPASATGLVTYPYVATGPGGRQDFVVRAVPTCNPQFATTSNVAPLTVFGCTKSPPPPDLFIDSPIAPMGSVVSLIWDSPSPFFAGTYMVMFSTDNGATFSPFAGGPGNAFSFTVQFPVGTTIVFEVVADPGCGPAGVSDPSPTVTLQVVQTCPRAGSPVAQVDKTQVPVGDAWSLHWTATLPAGQSGPAGVYEIDISEDNGATFHAVGTTTSTTFTGPPVPQADLGKLVFLQVIAKPSCGTGGLSSGYGNVVFFSVLPGCEAPQAARNALISAVSPDGRPVNRAPFPTEPLSLSWDAPASGTPATGYLVGINGDVPGFVSGGTGTIAPPRGNANPVTLFVTSVACSPQKQGPTIHSPTVALSTAPPGANFTISPNPRVGQPVTFTDTSDPQATGWLYLFDDGTLQTVQSPTKTFAAAGTHTVALVATNGAGSSTKVQSFFVNPASSTVTLPPASETIGFAASEPGRRRAAVDLSGPGRTWLQLSSTLTAETTLFLRFLDGKGGLLEERRLVVPAGTKMTQDLGAYGLKGSFALELVGEGGVSAVIVRTERSTTEIHR